MTPTEIDITEAAIKAAFPRAKWTKEEWSIWSEGMRHIALDAEQAVAVVRELKRSEVGYLSVAKMTKALRGAAPVTAAGCSPRTEGGNDRLAQMRREVGLPDATPTQVICQHYREAAALSVILRGYVRPCWSDAAVADLIELGGNTEAMAVSWAQRVAADHPTEPGPDYPETELQIWYVGLLDRASKRSVSKAAAEIQAEVEHDARPKKRAEARAAWERMKAAGDLAEVERRAMRGMAVVTARLGEEATV